MGFWAKMNRNSVTHSGFTIKPVEDFSIFNGFCCLKKSDTDRDLEDFIRNDAERHFKDKIAVTYGLFTEGSLVPLGFATLQNDAIVID